MQCRIELGSSSSENNVSVQRQEGLSWQLVVINDAITLVQEKALLVLVSQINSNLSNDIPLTYI